MSNPLFKIADLFNLNGSEIFNPDVYKPTSSFVIDSRKVKRGGIFIAIKGKNFDGHDFVAEAVKLGAGAVIINRKMLGEFDELNCTIVTVKDTVKAFGELARIKREKLNYKVAAITGSNGKTTTKDFASVILSEKYKVHSTTANNNNHIGLPLTISEAKLTDEVLVVELGTNHFGEINYIAKIAQPDSALITNIGQAHLKYLKDKKSVLEEKKTLADVTEKRGGKILLNSDDKLLKSLIGKYSNVTTFGFKGSPDIKGEILTYDEEGYPTLRITSRRKNLEFKLNLLGEAQIANVLSAAAIALEMGLNKKEILTGISKLKPTPGRFEVNHFDDFTLIDDSYNSNPESIIAGIKSIKRIKGRKNKVVILGDIFELGDSAEKIHRELGRRINKLKPSEVLTIGKMMKFADEELTVNHKHFRSISSLFSYLKKMEIKDSVILVKGSRGMKMERVVEFLKERSK